MSGVNKRDEYGNVKVVNISWKSSPEGGCGGRGGGGGTPQSFIWEDTVLKSSPFPFYTPFFAQKYPFRMPSIDKWNRYMMGKWSLQPF